MDLLGECSVTPIFVGNMTKKIIWFFYFVGRSTRYGNLELKCEVGSFSVFKHNNYAGSAESAPVDYFISYRKNAAKSFSYGS